MAIRDAGATVGVVLNPATPLESIVEILPEIDLVLIMSVNPGFYGQHWSSVEQKLDDQAVNRPTSCRRRKAS